MTKMQLIQHHLGQIRDIIGTTPGCRENSLVLTKVDEAEMWASRNADFEVGLPEDDNGAGS